MSSNPFGEVPALPVAVAFGAVVFLVLLVLLFRRARATWLRAAVAAVVALYAAGIFANTLLDLGLASSIKQVHDEGS